jgi:hypothetical protein
VLIEPSSQVNETLLPRGTLLSAGKDSEDKELLYQTKSDLVVNRIKIARLSSVFVNKNTIGIREAREKYSGTKNDSMMEMLKMALGEPLPGDALPRYPTNTTVDFAFLTQLQTLLKFVNNGLCLELGELRSLIRLKNNRAIAADTDWQNINTVLTEAGTKRTNTKFSLVSSNLRDFDANLKTALGVNSLTDYFDTLPLVKNITELYQQRTRQDVKDFIVTKMYLSLDRFNEMMQIKVRIDNEWQEINAVLERAGQRKSANYSLLVSNPPDFEKTFQSALGTPIYPAVTGTTQIINLDSFYTALLTIEAYFFMSLEDFSVLMSAVNASTSTVSDEIWSKIYQLLATSYQQKTYAIHKAQLNKLRLGQTTIEARKIAVQTMMQLALGVAASDNSDLLGRIKVFLPKDTDTSLLEQASSGVSLAEKEWDSVCSILELAWRNRIPLPIAQKSNWLSLAAYNDTSTTQVQKDDANRWYTFGQRHTQQMSLQTQAPAALLGWAISSPLLCLTQGQRTLTLTLGFKPEQFNTEKITTLLKNTQPFQIEVSTEKGWLSAKNVSVSIGNYPNTPTNKPLKSLTWIFSFDETTDAISTLANTEKSMLKTAWPLLKLLLQARWDDNSKSYITDYPLFQSLLLEKVALDVKVVGLTHVNLQNDNSSLSATKPFEPFGVLPNIGSRLYFSHPELVVKKLKQLDINLQWMGVPAAKLGDYYKNYTSGINDNAAFKSKVTLVDQRLELSLNDAATLFNIDDATKPNRLSVADVSAQLQKTRPDYRYERLLQTENSEDVTTWQRYCFLELTTCDFQHTNYSSVAAAKSIELASAIANKQTISADTYKVNPPYTPKLKSFSLNYTASIELNVAELKNTDSDQIFHLHPFGYAPIQTATQNASCNFLPDYTHEGELYIGLSGVEAPQNLSMLLQMAEGSANPDLEVATVEWSVLSGNRWLPLDKGQLQADNTNGLLQSGIIKLQLDEVSPSTLLPNEFYWLRVAVSERCDSVCDTVGIDTQAVSAIFVNQDNADEHLNQPLPAESIKSLLEPIANIAAVKQPYTSYAAKPKEPDSHFNTRVSERLRHKQRAVSLWDYERLVLEQFPDIYKAKCLPAQNQETLSQVSIVVIPDVRNRLPFNPFQPKAPASLLADIEEFLTAHTPVAATIKVKNACYLPVKLRFAVCFQTGFDSSFYKQQLNEDVNRFLSPWAYEQGKDLVIGGKIYANAIIDFIERQPYVDYVAHFKLFLGDENGEDFQFIPQPLLNDTFAGYCVAANRPDAVLVAARNHDIDLITEINFGEQVFSGINYMKLELDFIVG